jgi:hypothetical protein
LFLVYILHYSQLKLRSGNASALFANPESSIVSLPQLPPEPEPLHDWFESAHVRQVLEGVNSHLESAWESHVVELQQLHSAAQQDMSWWRPPSAANVTGDMPRLLLDSASGKDLHFLVAGSDAPQGNNDLVSVKMQTAVASI